MNPSNSDPVVSIVLPTHNRSAFLKKTITSILSQTYKNFELLVIDDASTDDTEAIVSDLAQRDARVRYVKNTTNLKIVRSLNRGITEARGEYIARADDDDVWADDKKLEEQIAFLEEHHDHALVGTGAIVVNEKNEEMFRYLQPQTDTSIRNSMLLANPFVHPSVVFRKSVVEKVGPYDQNLKDAEDWEFWMRIGTAAKFYNLPTYSIFRFYGSHGASVKNRVSMAKIRMQIILKYRNAYPRFFTAYLFNLAQRLYNVLPYQGRLNDFLFKIKRKAFSGEN